AQDYEEAVRLYSEAIALCPANAVYYGNRSLAHLRTESYGYALADATRALQLDAAYVKGYYRRAASNMALGRFKAALRDYETVAKVRPHDRDARLKLQECSRIVKQKAFERAIASDPRKRSVVDSLDIESMSEERGPPPRGAHGAFRGSWRSWEVPMGSRGLLELLGGPCGVFKAFLEVLRGPCGVWEVFKGFHEILGGPPRGRWLLNKPQIFNGDFVDRGSFSVEVILTLFGFKLLYPDHFHLLRGNHETDNMNQIYGFEGEVKAKYTAQMFALFSEVFEWLPLAQCINGKVLVRGHPLIVTPSLSPPRCHLHGVTSPSSPPWWPMCDLLWSDPQPQQDGRSVSKRGVSCQFGPDVTRRFLERNRLDYVIRSHEVKAEGYEVAHGGRCVTVFSAPNYCDQMGNKGSYIHLRGSDLRPQFHQFTAV
ncbi:PPP5 phosphatase, partial [Nothoprocta pentlandii]|nr:PPP5 phosphatase [Nothoprocta pentlandii]